MQSYLGKLNISSKALIMASDNEFKTARSLYKAGVATTETTG
jgi:hypothetical protein